MSRIHFLLVSSFAAALLVAQEPTVYENGATLRVYQAAGGMDSLPELVAQQTPNFEVLKPSIDFRDDRLDFGPFKDDFFAVVLARLEVKAAGEYAFRLTSDDGSMLFLEKKVLIDHDGLHGPTAREAKVALAAGFVDLEIRFFEAGGGAELRLEWRPPGAAAFVLLPTEALSTPKGVVRVTSPGVKRLLRPSDARMPGDARPLADVHPAYELFTCRPEGFEPKVAGMDFLSDGRLVISTWDPLGAVYVLDGIHGDDRSKITVTKFAEGLAEPLGLKVIGEHVYVLQKQELTMLLELDEDGVADEYRTISQGWSVTPNFHEFAFGLEEKDAWLYFNLAIAIDPGGASTKRQAADRGRTARVNLETGAIEFLTSGLRTPNGIGKGPDGELFITDNQGDWLPSSKLLHLKPGAFYGSRAALPPDWKEVPETPPVAWLPQNEIGNSPGTPALFTAGPFAGQIAIADVTHGGINRVFVEKIDGVYQGAAFQFTQGLEAGINRITFRPDGTIFCGGIGSNGNWGQEGKQRFGLQRLKLKKDGTGAFEMKAVRALANGFEIELTEPLEPGAGRNAEDYELRRWRYVPTAAYGGPKVDDQKLAPKSVSVSTDGRRIFIELDGLLENHLYYFRLSRVLRSGKDEALWATECWYTLTKIPADRRGTPAVAPVTTPAEPRDEGWTTLFDGASTAAWTGFKAEAFPEKGWVIRAGALVHERGGGGGDIVTRELYEDFEFACEWKVEPGGNSGIMYLVGDQGDYPWSTGPECQVLDNLRHPDGRNKKTSAGALYAMIACSREVSLPAGDWNRCRILKKGSHIEHHLNGVKVVDYEILSPAWEELVKNSKFASMPLFGREKKGRIALQDHHDEVMYRKIRIRRL